MKHEPVINLGATSCCSGDLESGVAAMHEALVLGSVDATLGPMPGRRPLGMAYAIRAQSGGLNYTHNNIQPRKKRVKNKYNGKVTEEGDGLREAGKVQSE